MASDDPSELPVLCTERIELADGRYLIYYTFDGSPDEILEEADQ